MSWSGFRRDAAGDGRGERLRAPRRGGRTGEKKEAREAGGRAVGRAPLSRGPRRARAIERPRAPEPRRETSARERRELATDVAPRSRRESPLRARSCADLGRRHRGRLEEPRWPFSRLARRRKESTVAKRRAHPRSGAPRGVANPRTTIARRSGAGLGWFHVHRRRPEKRANQTVDSWVILRNAFDRSLIGRFRARTLWWTVRESSAAGFRDSFEGETRKKE